MNLFYVETDFGYHVHDRIKRKTDE